MKITKNILSQYLLGSLEERRAEEIDLQIISDADFEEELIMAEDDLMEDYLAGILSPPDTELFHKHFLVTAERKDRLKFLSLLRNYALKAAQEEDSGELSAALPESFFQKLRKLFIFNRPVTAALALIVVIFLIGISWRLLYYNSDQLSVPDNEIAELNRKNLSDLSEYKNFSNVSLISESLRDSGGTAKLPEDKLTEKVLFRLALPAATAPAEAFNIKVSSGQKAVLTLNQLRPYQNPNGQELRLILPASLLNKGDYEIEAKAQNEVNSPITYNFTVR